MILNTISYDSEFHVQICYFKTSNLYDNYCINRRAQHTCPFEPIINFTVSAVRLFNVTRKSSHGCLSQIPVDFDCQTKNNDAAVRLIALLPNHIEIEKTGLQHQSSL
jgi:hypothetical protein